jgi:signal transduction histidine kinase
MSLRTRLLLAFAVVVLIPIGMLAFGLRREMITRLSQEYQARVERVVEVIGEDLARESSSIAERLASLKSALVNDNRFRLATVAGIESERAYLLDYAGGAMRLTGLSMLQIQDGDGRILTSGHFRNEHGRIDATLAAALNRTHGVTLVSARAPDGEFLALARLESFVIAGRPFTLVGGVKVDEAFLARLARDRSIVVSLSYPGGQLSTGRPPHPSDAAFGELQVPLITSGAETTLAIVPARFQVMQPLTPLTTLLRDANAWFLLTAVGAGVTALLLAAWVSSRISRPLAQLAEKTAVLDLDRLDIDFEPGPDEVGRLARLLGDLAARLRTSTVRVRDAERRATVGALARQITHDIKNGLIPLRNVMRHLAQVARDEPGALPAIFAERQQTMTTSIAYLETLATSYQRLSLPLQRRDCDLNALVADVIRAAQDHEHVQFTTTLADVPPVVGDSIAFRRILENLTANAVDSLQSKPGRVTVSTQVVNRDGDSPSVRVTLTDTGRGMSPDEARRIFDDFYTTKTDGTGLGLSIVRRLVTDLHGTIGVESTPDRGTSVVLDFPAASPTHTA